MKKINQITWSVLLFISMFVSLTACAQAPNESNSGLKWYTDAMQAQKISNSTKKPIFGFFTGSDWCGWCRKLQAEVFAKDEFVKWANKNVVLLELDFPRSKELSPELKKQNSELQQAFKVQGYPTCWMFYLTDNTTTNQKSIEALGSVGYPQGAIPGKEELKFIDDANQVLKNSSKANATNDVKKKAVKRKK